jgi:very-short-patch-repair endonuclease
MPDLETLAIAEPETIPMQRGDSDDPSPWLEAYDAGVGSPLELKFLRLFEKHGIEVEKQVPVGPGPGGRPISQADFKVKDKKILIYIDGASFHTGNRLRRDRAIRKSLTEGAEGWKVLEFTAQDFIDATATILRSIKQEDS